jgi:hypothetical protein
MGRGNKRAYVPPHQKRMDFIDFQLLGATSKPLGTEIRVRRPERVNRGRRGMGTTGDKHSFRFSVAGAEAGGDLSGDEDECEFLFVHVTNRGANLSLQLAFGTPAHVAHAPINALSFAQPNPAHSLSMAGGLRPLTSSEDEGNSEKGAGGKAEDELGDESDFDGEEERASRVAQELSESGFAQLDAPWDEKICATSEYDKHQKKAAFRSSIRRCSRTHTVALEEGQGVSWRGFNLRIEPGSEQDGEGSKGSQLKSKLAGLLKKEDDGPFKGGKEGLFGKAFTVLVDINSQTKSASKK